MSSTFRANIFISITLKKEIFQSHFLNEISLSKWHMQQQFDDEPRF